ncbi:MAG: radical SAM protein [Anaerolineales bacterium]
MDKGRMTLPRPISGGLILSYRCSAACRHCMYACSPQWDGDWIEEAALEEGLAQLARTIQPSPAGPEGVSLNYGLHFTGGEPFLNYDLLLRAVEIADGLEIPSTFVETNGYWCREDAQAEERLRRLQDAGLKGILISVNPFYAEYVPFRRTERCVRVSRRVFGGNVMVYQQAYYRQFRRLGIEGRIPLEEYAEMTRDPQAAQHVELFLMGRAAHKLRTFHSHRPAETYFGQPCRPSFLRNWHNHFDNYGHFLPGYCGGISLGNWHDLERLTTEGIDLEEHPVLAYLMVEDMDGLLNLAHDFGYETRDDGYISRCDLCLDIRKHLLDAGDFEELAPKEFYAHLSDGRGE